MSSSRERGRKAPFHNPKLDNLLALAKGGVVSAHRLAKREDLRRDRLTRLSHGFEKGLSRGRTTPFEVNIHEFQAKQLLADHGIPVPSGCAATSLEEAEAAMEALPDGPVVVKAQDPCAGGRGVGTFSNGFEGGVRVASSKEEALKFARRMLGNTLITHQTGSAGRLVQTIYLTEYCEIAKEYYLAILVDRTTSRPVIIASTEGGVDIERVAQERPERIVRVSIDPTLGLRDFQARSVAFALGLANIGLKQVIQIIGGLYLLFWEKDASLVEINPLIVTGSGELVALDAKVAFDGHRALPASRNRCSTRSQRRKSQRGGSIETLPQLHRSRWGYRLYGKRRRPGHGHHGHHQALWRKPGQLPRRRWRRH